MKISFLILAFGVAIITLGCEKDNSQIPAQFQFQFETFIDARDNHEYKYIKIGIKDIMYIKAEGNYILIKTVNKSFMIRSSLGSFMKKVPPGKFFQTHKSYIINLDHLDSITGNEVILAGESILLSRNFKDKLMKAINIG